VGPAQLVGIVRAPRARVLTFYPPSKPRLSAGRAVIDASEPLLLRIQFIGPLSDEVFEAHLREYAGYIRRGPYAVVYDSRLSVLPPATQRKRQAEWIHLHLETIRRNCLGLAFCASSPWIRGVVTAVFWMQAPPAPYVVTDTLAEAERWVAERLAAFRAGGGG
jgi:hypothetical protein